MFGRQVRVWALLATTAVLAAGSMAASAHASTEGHDQGIRIFSLQNPALGFAPNGSGQVVLATLGADSAGKWNVTEVGRQGFEDAVYTNVATGTCLAARSPIDGLALVMAPCNTSDPRQQWTRSADLLVNVSTARCVRPEAVAPGARLYQEVCSSSDRTTEFGDNFRVKLSIVAGNNQQIPAGSAGQPLVVKITDEDGQPLSGFIVQFQLRGPWIGEDFDVSPATFGPGTTTQVFITSNAQGLATTPAVTGKANTRKPFSVALDARFRLFGDLHLLQNPTFQGAVI